MKNMRNANNDVPIETLFKNLLKDYKRALEWNQKLAKYAKDLEAENKSLKERVMTTEEMKKIRREQDSIRSKLRNYDRWKTCYKSMCVMLKRHNIPFKLELELLKDEGIDVSHELQ